MKLALVNGFRTEPLKGARGNCPSCGLEVIAKCGEVKVNHWAHKGTRSCDPWWENETGWHRSWKNKFPEEWQEVVLIDERTGERHIADVRTSHGLVVEFQHSYIDPNERRAREEFYRNMTWVVDGMRLKRDLNRFNKGKQDLRPVGSKVYLMEFPEELLPSAWLESLVPVIFDFVVTPLDGGSQESFPLYCLLPNRLGRSSVIVELSRESFIDMVTRGEWVPWVNNLITQIEQRNAVNRNIARELSAGAGSFVNPRGRRRGWGRGRIF